MKVVKEFNMTIKLESYRETISLVTALETYRDTFDKEATIPEVEMINKWIADINGALEK